MWGFTQIQVISQEINVLRNILTSVQGALLQQVAEPGSSLME
jgi:hypothetical protein